MSVENPESYCSLIDSIKLCANASDGFCSDLPLEVYDLDSKTGAFPFGYSASLSRKFQPSFDNFSWQSFVALNWPSDATGNPVGESITDYKDSLRVWEHYSDASKVFDTHSKALKKFKAKHQNAKVLSEEAKVSSSLQLSGFLEADDYPLIDKNLNFVMYEVKMNAIEENFIHKHNLTTKKGIYDYYQTNGEIQLPINTKDATGAIEIKTSWRILDTDKGDDLSKYYTRSAKIFVSADESISGKSFSFDCTIGLVGMHIIRKTGRFKEWIWSTFEHVDNVPNDLQKAQTQQQTQWSFYNPECLNCDINTPPSHVTGDTLSNGKVVYRWNTTAPYGARYANAVDGEAEDQKIFGTQVTRTYPIYFCTEQLNTVWQDKLRASNSVFANYKLVGTQWTHIKDTYPPSRTDVPKYLGNSTAETYMQNTSSCIGCHNFASIKYPKSATDTITIKTDFSFTFGYAQ